MPHLPFFFHPGPLDFSEADHLKRLTEHVGYLLGTQVCAPLEMVQTAGGYVIKLRTNPESPTCWAVLSECTGLRAHGSVGVLPSCSGVLAEKTALRGRCSLYSSSARLIATFSLQATSSPPQLALGDCTGYGTCEGWMNPQGVTGVYIVVTGVACINGVIVQTTQDLTFTNGALTDVV